MRSPPPHCGVRTAPVATTVALGITYASKHGAGRCWAYWLADSTAAGLACDNGCATIDTDADLRRVTNRFRIRIRIRHGCRERPPTEGAATTRTEARAA